MLRPITVLLLLVLALAICSAAPATSAASPTPVVRLGTIAGSPFQLGSADGVGSAARFTFPRGIAISPDETFALVADTDNHTIRHITLATAQVTTIAGSPGQVGSTDGIGTAARFNGPRSVILSHDGSFALIADFTNQTIRRLDLASGAVTTIAGSPGQVGSTDGISTAARFAFPFGIALTADDSVALITDSSNYTIRKLVLASGAVTTIAGSPLQAGSADGTGAAARFLFPYGIGLSADGSVAVVADNGNYTVRKVEVATGTVTTLAGQAGQPGSADGVGAEARFSGPQGVGLSADGGMAVIADPINYTLRQIEVASGATVTIAGKAGSGGSDDGIGDQARLNGPVAVALNPTGTIALVTDTGNQTIRRADFVALQAVYVPMAAR